MALVELPCTGGPYLAILTVIAQQGVNLVAYLLLIVYNLIFVGPLFFIIIVAYLGTYSVSEMKQWKHMNRPRMRLAGGLLMILLGWVLLILAMGISGSANDTMTDSMKVCDRGGDKEEFDQRKLYASIYHPAREAEYGEKEAEDLAEDVVDEFMAWFDEHEDDVLTSKEIREKVEKLLEERDEDVAFLYRTHLDIN